MIRVVQFSGGKDSTALVLWAREHFDDQFLPLYCDTGWEHELTYDYIARINRDVLGGRLVTVKSGKYPGGMLQLVTEKGRVPSAKGRFCTDELKIQTTKAFLATLADETVVYQGVRGDESEARFNAGARLWSDDYDSWVFRPLYRWTVEQVFAMHDKYGIDPNPLYKLGAGRVGCFPCVMVNQGEMRRVGITLPLVWRRAQDLEDAAGATFFPPHYIPARYASRVSEQGSAIPTVAEVREYLESADRDQIRLWDKLPPSGCLSVYNQCE